MVSETANESSHTTGWTSTSACVIGIVCLVIGVAAGHFLRSSGRSQAAPTAVTSVVPAQAPSLRAAQEQMQREQLKQMAQAQAVPLTERLKKEPNNPQLLADIGNLYFDGQEYQRAVEYYQRSLKVEPKNANVRTDLGIALWYLGDVDGSIEQFNTVLKFAPTQANTLMNLGVVQWQGKMNAPAAVAAWEKLLATNPNFEGRQDVEKLIAQAKKHLDVKAKTAKDAM